MRRFKTNMKKTIFFSILMLSSIWGYGQQSELDSAKYERMLLDSMFIAEVEDQPRLKPKVLHAEPLYIDLIRDLGARKGEKEWNVGAGMTDRRGFTEFETLIEYEWAPIDRLGLEIEVPVTLYSANRNFPENARPEVPANRVESLKLAAQWSFFVSEKAKTTLALGYIHEFEFVDLNQITRDNVFKGNIYNPFFIAAKRWGSNYHTLVYTGPRIIRDFGQRSEVVYEINSNFHYMITGTRNFIGVEVNSEVHSFGVSHVLRPQMRLGLAENLLIGIVTGIPVNRNEFVGLSSFMRIIYEPGFRTFHK
ncbi:hypothetical protein A3SI_04457 [Nitritalea halalkaliphila LW7]|uniref:Phosphoribosylformylglycinamidine synthase n=2 Tax=Nitritalea TaxID=1187887 RepID=I5C896_9BACT|nr:hypothetical protein A3SI_04457 [Nitritalea halalkaliphila LW7]